MNKNSEANETGGFNISENHITGLEKINDFSGEEMKMLSHRYRFITQSTDITKMKANVHIVLCE